REETSARAVRALAPPVGAVGRGLGFAVGHRLDLHAVVRGDDLHEPDVITVGARLDLARRDDEASALAAAPFAGRVLERPARNPAVVRGDRRRRGERERGGKRRRAQNRDHWEGLSNGDCVARSAQLKISTMRTLLTYTAAPIAVLIAFAVFLWLTAGPAPL